MATVVVIPCDDSQRSLRLVQGDDGDMWVSIIDEEGLGLEKSVRICTSQGSGRFNKLKIRDTLQDVLEEAEKAGFGIKGGYQHE